MRSSTETLITALRVLAQEIHCEDGTAQAALSEAADRLEELDAIASTIGAKSNPGDCPVCGTMTVSWPSGSGEKWACGNCGTTGVIQ